MPPASATGADADSVNIFGLTEALNHIPRMQEADFRATLIRAISTALGGNPLSPPNSDHAPVHIFNIVQTCHDRPGGIAALSRSIDLLAGDTPEAMRFCRLASPAEPLIGTDDEDRLREPLEQCALPEVARLFSIAVDGMIALPATARNAWGAFVHLADANLRTDGVPPHVAFVELLAILLRNRRDPRDIARASVLRAWVTEQIGKYQANGHAELADRIQQFRTEAAAPTGPYTPMTMIIMLEEDLRNAPGSYVVTHWRQMDPVRWRPERVLGERVVGVDEIPATITSLLRKAERDWAGRFGGPLNLEVILPNELMNLDVDQWPGKEVHDSPTVPIGTQHEVVLRSRQRLYTWEWHREWITRSQRLAAYEPTGEVPNEPGHGVHRCPPELAGDARRLRLHLSAKKSVLAYLLSSPPDREPGRSELPAALRSGLPVIIWARDPTAQAELWSAVDGRPLPGLPEKVKDIRTNAALHTEPSLNFGRHISLIWDRYDRFIGPTDPLSPPL